MEIVKDTLYIGWNNPKDRFTLGIDNQIFMNLIGDEDDEDPTIEFKYMLTLGFLIFNIIIIY